VYYDINETIEKNVIEPLTDIFFNNGTEIKTLLKALLTSEHFYDDNFRGCMIKNPMDLAVGTFRLLEIQQPPADNPVQTYSFWNWIYSQASGQNMTLGNPPDVAGWTAWYLAPLYNELWITSATLPSRTALIKTAVQTGVKTAEMTVKAVMDPFKMAGLAANPGDINDLIQTLAGLLLPVAPTAEMIAIFKDVMIPGLPDGTWTSEWNKYISNPNDQSQKTAVSNRLIALINKMTSIPEFQLN
jgi:hypothetical protein